MRINPLVAMWTLDVHLVMPTTRQACRSTLLSFGLAFSLSAAGSDLRDDLQRYNRLTLSRDAQLYSPDGGEAAAFKNYEFTCHRQGNHIPAETQEASEAFQRFVVEARAHVDTDADDRRRRVDLLAKAVASGGWRARYFDAMWGIWLERDTPDGRRHFETLLAMAEAGNPAALYGLLTWSGGMYEDMPQRIVVLKAAVDRGNPQVLSIVGHDLATRTRDMRAMGVKMLECAAAQGDGNAYEGLARIAWMGGHWVDAYRKWQQGANLGCRQCLNQMDDFALTQPDAERLLGTVGQEPRVAALRRFFESQFLYDISHLIELRVPAPPGMQLQWTDADVVAVIKARIRRYGLP